MGWTWGEQVGVTATLPVFVAIFRAFTKCNTLGVCIALLLVEVVKCNLDHFHRCFDEGEAYRFVDKGVYASGRVKLLSRPKRGDIRVLDNLSVVFQSKQLDAFLSHTLTPVSCTPTPPPPQQQQQQPHSGSVLVTAERLTSTNLTYSPSRVTTETASFVFMETRKKAKFTSEKGAIMQSLDVLDLSVIHLSAYERSLRSRGFNDVSGPSVDRLRSVARLQQKNANSNSMLSDVSGVNVSGSGHFDRTLVIMPWAGLLKGVGNSKLTFRSHYLKTCFWSFYKIYKSIVIAVPSDEEAKIITNILNLPAKEVLILDDDVIKRDVKRLPMELLKRVQGELLTNNKWNSQYDFVLYTESDHLLVLNRKRANEAYEMLQEHPHRVLVPHRLMPYAHELMQASFGFRARRDAKFIYSSMDEEANAAVSCCLPRQNCDDGRKGWVKIGDPKIPFIVLDGLLVALGNANFRDETYRHCSFRKNGTLDVGCP